MTKRRGNATVYPRTSITQFFLCQFSRRPIFNARLCYADKKDPSLVSKRTSYYYLPTTLPVLYLYILEQYKCFSPKCHPETICNVTTGKCECPAYDKSVYEPVCGTDGSDYNSKEELRYKACLGKTNVKVAIYDTCSSRKYEGLIHLVLFFLRIFFYTDCFPCFYSRCSFFS